MTGRRLALAAIIVVFLALAGAAAALVSSVRPAAASPGQPEAAVSAAAAVEANPTPTPHGPTAPGVSIAVSDSGMLAANDTTVGIVLTITCDAGFTAYGSVAVSTNTNAGDTSSAQAYSGLLRIPCTGAPIEQPLTMVSAHAPFTVGAFLARAGFTLNECDDTGCRYASLSQPINLVRP